MNNNFDMLVRVVLNEANIGDYIRKATRAVTHGVAKVADVAARDSGLKYGGGFGSVANKMKEWGDKHKAEIEKRDLKSAPYMLLKKQQDKGLIPSVGDTITMTIPSLINRFTPQSKTSKRKPKQIIQVQVVDVSTNARANTNRDADNIKIYGTVIVTSIPVSRNNIFDTIVTKFSDINNPLHTNTSTVFYRNNAIVNIPQLTATVSRKNVNTVNGYGVSWQFRSI